MLIMFTSVILPAFYLILFLAGFSNIDPGHIKQYEINLTSQEK